MLTHLHYPTDSHLLPYMSASSPCSLGSLQWREGLVRYLVSISYPAGGIVRGVNMRVRGLYEPRRVMNLYKRWVSSLINLGMHRV